jgi:hypothetical protein
VPKVSTVRSRNSFVNKSIEFVNRWFVLFLDLIDKKS